MKIELKNTSFQQIVNAVGACNELMKDLEIREIYYNELLPQYEEYFLKYQNEKQEY